MKNPHSAGAGPRDPRIEASLRRSVRDGVAFSAMTGSGETYFAAFAIFMKASAAQISMLAALPPLLGSFMQLYSAWLGQRRGARRGIILTGALLQALTWFPLVLLPIMFPNHAVALFIACVVLYYAWVNLAAPQWSSLMGDIVPERRRGRFFARRTGLMSITTFITLLMAGLVLHLTERGGHTLAGFVAIFAFAALARFYSVYQLARMYDPVRAPSPLSLPAINDVAHRLRASQFARFSVFFALMNFAVAIASPFFTLYMLRDLQFSYLQFTVSTAASIMIQFLTLSTWGRMADVFGNRLIMVTTASIIPVLPALWLVSSDFWWIVAVQLLGGLSWAGFSLSAGNFLYDAVAAEKRAAYAAIHNVLSSVAIFCGALLGGLLSAIIPREVVLFGHTLHWTSSLWGVLLISSAARAFMALGFIPLLREVREVRPLSASGLIFRVIRYTPLMGMMFEILALKRRKPKPPPPASAAGKAPG
jgi:MFS family permease